MSIRFLIQEYKKQKAKEQGHPAMKDMRAEFEAWARKENKSLHVFSLAKHPNEPRYLEIATELAWLSYQAAVPAQEPNNASIAAMEYALKHQDIEFLQVWFHGNFDAIRKEWPDAPESVFVGADPLYVSPQQPAQEPIAEKALVWFNALQRIAKLLEMPEDQPIIQAVDVLENLLKQPAQQTAQEPAAYRVGKYLTENKKAAEFEASEFSLPLEQLYTKPFMEPVKQESWISVEERLPENGTEFIACLFYKQRPFDKLIRIVRSLESDEMKVTHWMPLPLPPVEVKE